MNTPKKKDSSWARIAWGRTPACRTSVRIPWMALIPIPAAITAMSTRRCFLSLMSWELATKAMAR